jgi:hypothetical protein
MSLDKQIRNLNQSLGAYASDGGGAGMYHSHLMDENSFLKKKRMNNKNGYLDTFGIQGRKM